MHRKLFGNIKICEADVKNLYVYIIILTFIQVVMCIYVCIFSVFKIAWYLCLDCISKMMHE